MRFAIVTKTVNQAQTINIVQELVEIKSILLLLQLSQTLLSVPRNLDLSKWLRNYDNKLKGTE